MRPIWRFESILILIFLSMGLASCRGLIPGIGGPAPGPGGEEPLEGGGACLEDGPFPYIDDDTLFSEEERAGLREKFCPISRRGDFLNAMVWPGHGGFPEWEPALQRKLLLAIKHYEDTRGEERLPFTGSCVIDGEGEPCFRMSDPLGVHLTRMSFNNPEYLEHLVMSHFAWHLFVEANDITSWSILDYSATTLSHLFDYYRYETGWPGLRMQYAIANLYPGENYQIVRGSYREPGDIRTDLLDDSPLNTILNLVEFIGQRVVHHRGAGTTCVRLGSHLWPYRTRSPDGTVRLDPEGRAVKLNRLPTPAEVLILRNPQRNTVDALDGPEYHIVNGCLAGTKLVKSLLSSVNLPVEMVGDYATFSFHSGLRFPDIEGHDYYIYHSDDMYEAPYFFTIMRRRGIVAGEERWDDPDMEVFSDFPVDGYGILIADRRPAYDDIDLDELGITGERAEAYREAFRLGLNQWNELSRRILSMRMLADQPPIELVYARCAGLPMSKYMPLSFLTDAEKDFFSERLVERHDAIATATGREREPGCFKVYLEYYDELAESYFRRTGLQLLGDADGDGKPNYMDCHVRRPDPHDSHYCGRIHLDAFFELGEGDLGFNDVP